MKKINIALILLQVGAIITSWRTLPPQLPLFYSRPWGETQLATPFGLFLLPALSLAVFLINFFFTGFIPKEEKLTGQILAAASTVFSLLCLATLAKIIFLVTP